METPYQKKRRLQAKSHLYEQSRRSASTAWATIGETLQTVHPTNAPFTQFVLTKNRQSQIDWDYTWRRVQCASQHRRDDPSWSLDVGYCIDRYSVDTPTLISRP
jgi:hypothetical protein